MAELVRVQNESMKWSRQLLCASKNVFQLVDERMLEAIDLRQASAMSTQWGLLFAFSIAALL